MKYTLEKIEQEIKDLLQEKVSKERIVLNVVPETIKYGSESFDGKNYQIFSFNPIATAKINNLDPGVFAQELCGFCKNKIKDNKESFLSDVHIVGPYINFSVDRQKFITAIAKEIEEMSDRYGCSDKRGELLGIEYVSPNTNKPLHLGHARNAFLGRSLSLIAEAAGHEVKKINLFNDRGTHICKSMLAYKKWGEGKTPQSENMKPDHFVGKYYQLFVKEAEKDPGLEDEAQKMLSDWEGKDKDVRELWKKMNEWFYEGVNFTFDRIGTVFDHVYKESEIYQEGRQIVENALKNGKCYQLVDGAVEVDLEEKKLGKKVLLRKDGTTVYIVQDIYLAQKKFEDFSLDKSIYVVADEQKYHFDVLFELLDRFGVADKDKNYHLAYGMVELAEGKMSSRKGTVINIDNILDELKDLAVSEIEKREPDIDVVEKNNRAEAIAQAALKYKLLESDKDKKIVFDKAEALKFEGKTGPYLLYTYARIQSILKKADNKIEINVDHESKNDLIYEIVEKISCLSKIISRASETNNPPILARYLFSLSHSYNEFYNNNPVLNAENKIKQNTRLLLTKMVSQVLKNGMTLLGIDVLERM